MTQATLANKQARFFQSCCENPSKWVKLPEFCQDNYLSRRQIYLLARKLKVELIIYRGKYQARWAEGFNKDNYDD